MDGIARYLLPWFDGQLKYWVGLVIMEHQRRPWRSLTSALHMPSPAACELTELEHMKVDLCTCDVAGGIVSSLARHVSATRRSNGGCREVVERPSGFDAAEPLVCQSHICLCFLVASRLQLPEL